MSCEVCQQPHNSGITFNKPLVEIHNIKEGLNFLDYKQDRPFLNCGHSVRVHVDAVNEDNEL